MIYIKTRERSQDAQEKFLANDIIFQVRYAPIVSNYRAMLAFYTVKKAYRIYFFRTKN